MVTSRKHLQSIQCTLYFFVNGYGSVCKYFCCCVKIRPQRLGSGGKNFTNTLITKSKAENIV